MLASHSWDVTLHDSPVYVSPRFGFIETPHTFAQPNDSKPGMWSVRVGKLGSDFSAYFDAVIDDYGSLVRVGPAIA